MSVSILAKHLDDIKELAIIAALNVGAGAIFVVSTTNSPAALAAKNQLMNHVTGEVRTDGKIILTLDMMACLRVSPLYIVFASCWNLAQVRESVLQTMRRASAFDGLTYDLQLNLR